MTQQSTFKIPYDDGMERGAIELSLPGLEGFDFGTVLLVASFFVAGYVIGHVFPFYWVVERLFPFIPAKDVYKPPHPTQVEVFEKVGHYYRARIVYSDGRTRIVRGNHDWRDEVTGNQVPLLSPLEDRLRDARDRYKLAHEMGKHPGDDAA